MNIKIRRGFRKAIFSNGKTISAGAAPTDKAPSKPRTGRQLNDPKKPSLESVIDYASVLVCIDKSGVTAVNYVATDLGISKKQARQVLVDAGVLVF